MRKTALHFAIALAVLAASALPAAAWGPRAQLAIVTTAAHLIAKEGAIPLNRLEEHIRRGAMVSRNNFDALYPQYDSDPISAIQQEMALLQAVRGDIIDNYFAYRLGALGKLVAETTEPLQDVRDTYRNVYFADVEQAVSGLSLEPGSREIVEPQAYFSRKRAAAGANNAMIKEEYETGVGFQGVARQTLQQDASRSVDAVADVWHTILSSTSVPGGVSQEQIREYVVRAYQFYINRGKPGEIDKAEARLSELTTKTPDMSVRIGDLYYQAGFFKRAIDEYETVLAASTDRREVVEKIATYYMEQGEQALDDGRLADAKEAFSKALEVNPLHPLAERRRLETAEQIEERDARRAANQQQLDQAAELQRLAEQEALRGRFAEAVVLLREALHAYQQVTEEFPVEHQKSITGIKDARYLMDQYKEEIIASAQQYSGAGFALDFRTLPRTKSQPLNEETLKTLIQAELAAQNQALENELRNELAPQ